MTRLEKSTTESAAKSEVLQPLNRVFIANRGEIANRILDACVDRGIGAVIAYSSADKNSLVVRKMLELTKSDERYAAAYIGPEAPHTSYEDPQSIVASALAYDCDAVHPGYGFLAESSAAVHAITEAGLRFIGPSSDVIDRVGDKESARQTAKRLKIPLLEGTQTLTNAEAALRAGKKLKFPLMLKAQNAGGGNGNKIVHNQTELRAVYQNLSLQFIDVYAEQYLPGAKHVEIQIAGDSSGTVTSLGERDCSAQRKFQKVVEESPSPGLSEVVRKKMEAAAVKMAKDLGYIGLGTWEFLVAGDEYYFLEVNPRIQVEHPVTEERLGINLIDLQLSIAEGHQLPKNVQPKNNHVIELRLYAEKPEQDFAADAGELTILRFPQGVRVDTGYEEGDVIPAPYDKTIAKLIASGETREEARILLANALEATTITGVNTNKEFLLWLLDTREFRDGEVTTTFIENAWKEHRKKRLKDVSSFFADGDWLESPKPGEFNIDAFPQNIQYIRDGVSRNYREEMTAFQAENPTQSAFRYGIYQKDGIHFMLGFWDFEKFGGSMGGEEGLSIESFIEMAATLKLPMVTLTSTPGARQQENSIALLAMELIAQARNRYRADIPLFINVYHGGSYGGVNASLAESADIKFATNDAQIGLTGPDMQIDILGLKSRDELPADAYSAVKHFTSRNVDVLVRDLNEARKRVMHLLAILPRSNAVVVEGAYSPALDASSFESLAPSRRYDKPEGHRSVTIISDLWGSLLQRAKPPSEVSQRKKTLNNTERKKIIEHPDRPTAADYLHPSMGIFENVSPLSNRQNTEGVEQFPPIIGAVVEIDGKKCLFLGQQTQRKKDENGNIKKDYLAIRNEDFEWATRMVKFATAQKIPIILMGDTTGADASLTSEYKGISNNISKFLELIGDADVPVSSINIGQNGSGGGLTFIRPVDRAADLSNALTLVSNQDVQARILLKRKPSAEETEEILLQLMDARAETRLAMRQVDTLIPESPGGAHTDPLFVAQGIRQFLIDWLTETQDIPSDELKIFRYQRVRDAFAYVMRPARAT